MESKRINRVEKELSRIVELDNVIKNLQMQLKDENERYAVYAYQVKPPADNTRGYNSVKGVSDPTSKAAEQLEMDKFECYVEHIKDGIRENNDKRIELIQKLTSLNLKPQVKRYAYQRYVKGSSAKESAIIVDISRTCATRYRAEILQAYADKYNF